MVINVIIQTAFIYHQTIYYTPLPLPLFPKADVKFIVDKETEQGVTIELMNILNCGTMIPLHS